MPRKKKDAAAKPAEGSDEQPAAPKENGLKFFSTESSEHAWLRAMLYGGSGFGKTYSIRTLPLKRILVLLAEPKHLPLRRHKVDAIRIETWSDVKEAFRFIRAGLADGKLEVNGQKKDIIVIDSLSELNEKCKREIVTKDRPALLERQRKKDVGGIYDEQLTMPDWQLLGTRIDNLTGAFCNLPAHVIITCLEAWTEDKATGEQLIAPALNGKLAQTIAHHFDEVYHLEIQKIDDEQVRFFRTMRTAQTVAKGSECLDELEEAHWTKVMSKIFAKKKGD